MIFIQDILIMENFSDIDFPYTVKWVFPRELNREKIFQDNLSHTLSDLKELLKERELLDGNKKFLSYLHFDSQIEKQKSIIKENERKIEEISRKMNEGISPYHWKLLENVDIFEYGIRIKADYVLSLVYG